jgi:hypothetical protein
MKSVCVYGVGRRKVCGMYVIGSVLALRREAYVCIYMYVCMFYVY